MRIAIEHNTVRTGFIFKNTYYQVSLKVDFSHEEKQIIRGRGLLDTKLLDRRPADARVEDRDEKFELRVADIMDGRVDAFFCANPSQAKIYEERLLVVLAQMKEWLEDNAETGGRTVVEL